MTITGDDDFLQTKKCRPVVALPFLAETGRAVELPQTASSPAPPAPGPPGQEWLPGQRWWGQNCAGEPMEIDVVAESTDGNQLLVGECKLTASAQDLPRLYRRLRQRAASLPFAGRYRNIHHFLFVGARTTVEDYVIPPDSVLAALE